ncbi:aldehyde dehydrogenase family protein, partial [Nocardia vinacea]|uniref:aldehyde dehydrogenase family protein n=1 Tax=Nocardia vinacea TaxID=96468 RepID=UPI001C3F18C5
TEDPRQLLTLHGWAASLEAGPEMASAFGPLLAFSPAFLSGLGHAGLAQLRATKPEPGTLRQIEVNLEVDIRDELSGVVAPTLVCAAALGPLIAEHTDIPAGVLNIVTSDDHTLGARLVEDPRVDMITFTGSTQTGRSVMAGASASLKRTFLELGGKSAAIVLDDADIAGAASYTAFSVALHAGQGCALTTRMLVPRAAYDEAVAAAAKALSGIRADDPTKPGTVCGPLISARQRDRVERYLDIARAEGGRIVVGGGRPSGKDRGFFVEPTLIAGLGNTATVAQEEIFGPVLVVIPYDGDADAIRLANESPYGLSGSVWGADPERVDRVVSGVRTGTLSVNGGLWYHADAPFGGYKQSGIGREMGVAGFEEYLETKLIATPA